MWKEKISVRLVNKDKPYIKPYIKTSLVNLQHSKKLDPSIIETPVML